MHRRGKHFRRVFIRFMSFGISMLQSFSEEIRWKTADENISHPHCLAPLYIPAIATGNTEAGEVALIQAATVVISSPPAAAQGRSSTPRECDCPRYRSVSRLSRSYFMRGSRKVDQLAAH
jgi:hypothetical protein